MPDYFSLHVHGLATETNKSCLFNDAESATILLLFFRSKISSDQVRFASQPLSCCDRRRCRLRFSGMAIDFNRRGCDGVGGMKSLLSTCWKETPLNFFPVAFCLLPLL